MHPLLPKTDTQSHLSRHLSTHTQYVQKESSLNTPQLPPAFSPHPRTQTLKAILLPIIPLYTEEDLCSSGHDLNGSHQHILLQHRLYMRLSLGTSTQSSMISTDLMCEPVWTYELNWTELMWPDPKPDQTFLHISTSEVVIIVIPKTLHTVVIRGQLRWSISRRCKQKDQWAPSPGKSHWITQSLFGGLADNSCVLAIQL